jgi:hypothetical protein
MYLTERSDVSQREVYMGWVGFETFFSPTQPLGEKSPTLMKAPKINPTQIVWVGLGCRDHFVRFNKKKKKKRGFHSTVKLIIQ